MGFPAYPRCFNKLLRIKLPFVFYSFCLFMYLYIIWQMYKQNIQPFGKLYSLNTSCMLYNWVHEASIFFPQLKRQYFFLSPCVTTSLHLEELPWDESIPLTLNLHHLFPLPYHLWHRSQTKTACSLCTNWAPQFCDKTRTKSGSPSCPQLQ